MERRKVGGKRGGLKKVTSIVLAFSIVASGAISGALQVNASDTLPYLGDSARGTNQAYAHGYRTVDLKNWSPQTDPYSESMRAQIPLQTRNDTFSATQANPNLNSETQMFTLAGDYGNAFFDSYQYTNEFSQYLFNYWQYTDYYGSWHGLPTEDVPESMYVNERGVTDAWKNRKFEFGVINMPNPGYTNAAHKNGVKSIGCIFLPRTGQSHAALLTQDAQGKYPYADQLTRMCKWYGFDGYFINQEESIPSTDIPKYKAFMKQMRDQGVYIQWYDSVTAPNGGVSYQNEFNNANSSFVKDTSLGQVSDSIFLNYWWNSTKLTNSSNLAKSLGLNPLSTVFAGIEAGGGRWNQPYNLRNNLNANGQPMNAIASLGSEFVHDGLDEDLDGGANNNIEMRREKDDYQWMTFQRERMWWTGMTQDPTTAQDRRRDASYANAGIGVNTGDKWDGVSAYITERSVIKGDTFVTNFNTGHGLEYVSNGTVSNSHEWSNIVIQDILPTWQWWQETTGTKMTVDFDYGAKYQKTLADKTAGKFDFDLVGAYSGGSSLVVSGKLDADNFLHLYKTNLDVKAASKMNITFKKTSSDTAAMKLGVIFADDPTKVVKLDIAGTTAKSDSWVTSSVDFSSYAGKKIAAYGLVFTGASDKYQMNIGQMKYTSNPANKPAAPANFKIAKAYGTSAKEMTLTWDIAPYDTVKQYNIYADINGKEMYLGGTYDSTFYIKSLYDAAGPVTIKLRAVSADGTESDAATATYDYSKAISNVTVTPTEASLDVTFTAPAGAALGTTEVSVAREYSADTTTDTATSASGATTVSVPVTAKDGSRYTMRLTPKDSSGNTLESVVYDGKFIDKTADSYTGKVSGGKLLMPESKDWYKMYVTPVTGGVDGTQQTITRSQSAMPSVSASADSVKVVLEDYAGNKSKETLVPNIINVTISPNQNLSVPASQTMQFTASVKNYASDGSVTWSVSGARSAGTKISQTGLLTVGLDESAASIRVIATSNEDPTASGSANVTVVPAIEVTGSATSVMQGKTVTFTAKLYGQSADSTKIKWTVENVQKATAISADGLLTVAADESATSITVRAASILNPDITAVKTVTITLKPNLDGCVSIGAAILGASGNGNVGETKDLALDGNEDTKWCTSGKTGWLAIDLGKDYIINRWRTVQGEKGDKAPGFNTPKFALEVLKDPNASASDLKNSSYLSNSSNWTEVQFVDNSTDLKMVVDNTLAQTVSGRYFRLRIDDSCGNQYTAVRIHEFELYGEAAAVSPASIAPANSGTIYKGQEITYKVTYNGEPANASDYDWTVENATNGTEKSKNTTISAGVLKIADDEKAGTLKITAVKKDDATAKAISLITLADPISVSASSTNALQGDTVSCSATLNGENTDTEKFTWTVEAAEKAGTTISAGGVLTVAEDETAANVAVRATSKAHPLMSGTVSINISARPDMTKTASLPSVQKYDITSKDKRTLSASSRIFVVSNAKASGNQALINYVKLADSEFAAEKLPSAAAMPIVFGSASQAKAGDIILDLTEISETQNAEGYKIEIGDSLKISAPKEKGIFYGLRTLMQFIRVDGGLQRGTIVDYPSVSERSLHIDIARKFYTKDWIIQQIKDMSWMKLNTLQLHFSENEGFRIECSSHPEVMSSQYLTKAEVKEILAVAKQYGVDVVPSLDGPGHLQQALSKHPEFQLPTSTGGKTATALDITNPQARRFIKDLIDEYAELFQGCKAFNIGADEFINFDQFSTYPVMGQWAKQNISPDATGIDTYIDYINDIAGYVEGKGFTARIWNDGVFRANQVQKVELKKSIEICYWTKWDKNMATVQTFLDKGYKIINFNDGYFYYVLGENAGYKYPTGQKIFDNWNPGVFPTIDSNTKQNFSQPYPSQILGASFAIWSDKATAQTQDQVSNGIYEPLRAMAEKAWNPNLTTLTYDVFKEIFNRIGRAPGFSAALPDAEKIAYSVNIDKIANGTVTADKTAAAAGEKVTLTVKPDSGYAVGTVKVNGTAVTAANGVYSFTMPEGEAVVTADFYKVPATKYGVTIGAVTNGTVTADKTTAAAGEKVTLTVKPDAGYAVDTVKVNGTAVTAANGVYSFVMSSASVTVTASFKKTEDQPVVRLTETQQGVTVTGENGVVFDRNTKLVVIESNKSIPTVDGRQGIKLFDISLHLNDVKIQPDGKVRVTIKIPAEAAQYTNLGIVYVDDSGKSYPIASTINGDTITFIAEHFSLYGIVGTPKGSQSSENSGNSADSPKTGETRPVVPAAAVMLIFAGMIGWIALRRKSPAEQTVDRT